MHSTAHAPVWLKIAAPLTYF